MPLSLASAWTYVEAGLGVGLVHPIDLAAGAAGEAHEATSAHAKEPRSEGLTLREGTRNCPACRLSPGKNDEANGTSIRAAT
jgi:hypothetical protein